MSDTEESPVVRKTRSGRAVKTPAKPKVAAAKPAGRKTRKKVVVMEVEVTDDEESEQPDEIEEPAEKKAKIDEDKLLEASDGEGVEENNKHEDALLSSEDETEKKNDSVELVMNDVEMLEEISNDDSIEKTKNHEEINKNDVAEQKIKDKKENGVTETEEKEDTEVKQDVTEVEQDVTEVEQDVTEVEQDVTEVEQEVTEVKEEEKVVEATQEEEKAVEATQEEKAVEAIQEEEKTVEATQEKKAVAATQEEKKQVEEKTQEEKQVVKDKEINNSSQIEEKTETTELVEENKKDDKTEVPEKEVVAKQNGGDPEAENISDDELPGVPVAKVPEAEEVSDEELPGPKRAELPADTEVVSEDEELPEPKRAEMPADTEVVSEDEELPGPKRAELPADTEVVSEDELPNTKKEGEEDETPTPAKKDGKRKLSSGDYDPTSPTSENEAPSKKSKEDKDDKEKSAEKSSKPKKLPELDKYWKAVNDDPTDFTGWTYLLQYVDQENDMEAAREAYDAFLSHYPYCYGYWRKYADYEKRKGNKKKCEEVFERGLKAIPLSVDLWIHYLTYVKSTKGEEEENVRSQFERALLACGLEFRSDRLWDSYIKWESEGKRFQRVTALYDRLLATPTQGYTSHFDNFQEHVAANPPNKIIEVDEFLALRKEVRNLLKDDEKAADNADLPPGDEDSKLYSSDEETKCIRERIVSIRRKVHKNTVNAVTARWNYEEGIKRPYFHVKPLERCQLKNWQDYLDYEMEQGERTRIIVLFERCLIACALYEEFWLKFVHYLESLKDPELLPKIRDVYERACTIHHLKKPNLHLQWAIFEEVSNNVNRAAEILVNLEKQVPNVLQVAYRRINLERRRSDNEKCAQLFEHYIANSKNKMISSTIAIKYSRFCLKVLKDFDKARETIKTAIEKDPNNPRLYLQLIDLILQKPESKEDDVCAVIDEFLQKETSDPDQKALFAQRKLEYLEDFGASVESVQAAAEQFLKYQKLCKESAKKKEPKSSESGSSSKKEKPASSSTSQSASASYPNYNYGSSSSQPTYPYSGTQQAGQYGQYPQYGQGTGEQYQYQNWQYPQGGYTGYNQWGGYGGGYSY